MDEYAKGFIWGLIVAAVFIVLIWIVVAAEVEDRKIASGYLTRGQKVYSVELFDTLDTPEMDKDNSER